MAREHRYTEIGVNVASKVISFTRMDTRVNVYYTTRTVGTCVHHPQQGKTQLFRRDVNLHMLNAIFADPRVHTDRGYQRGSTPANGRKRGRSVSPTQWSRRVREAAHPHSFAAGGLGVGDGGRRGGGSGAGAGRERCVVGSEESEARTHLAQLLQKQRSGRQGRQSDLSREIENLQAFVDVYDRIRAANAEARLHGAGAARGREAAAVRAREAKRERQAAADASKRTLQRVDRGEKLLALNLFPRAKSLVVKNFDESCKCMAMSCDSDDVLMTFDTGIMTHTGGIPKAVDDLLQSRQSQPTFVCFGSLGRYYIKFEDGQNDWLGPEGLSRAIRENNSRAIASVAFGRDWDSYFVVFSDGFWCCNNIPAELAGIIASRSNSDDLQRVNLGPNGECFLMTRDAMSYYGGCAVHTMSSIAQLNHQVVNVVFGGDHACLIRHN